jgi:malonyl-CoA/methylmalonyl-CoA synthetase
MTVLDLLRRAAAREPTHLAIAFEQRRFSYADLEGASNAAARILRGAGATRGDRVLIHAGSSLETVLAILGTLKLGAIALPANPAYRDQELGWILEDAGPKVAVADAEGAARLAALPAAGSLAAILEVETGDAKVARGQGPPRFPFYQALRKASVHPVDEIVEDRDDALLIYTSGTTGRGKGARLTHGNLVANALALHEAFGETRDDLLLLALPLFHVHGLCVGLLDAIAAGASTILHRRFDAAAVLHQLRAERATMFMGVPTMYRMLLDAAPGGPDAKLDLKAMRLFVSGSAPLPATLKDEFERRTGHRILERYGMTETLITLAQRHDGERPAGHVGLPVAGIEARIVDSDLNDVAGKGAEGELLIRGKSVGPGYFGDAAATDASRHDGWFATGDIVRLDPEVGELAIVGRARELILTGGYNVYPREVEAVLETHPGVAEAAVYGAPDRQLGEAVHAAIVLMDGARVTEADLVEHCRAHIASYKKPTSIRFLTALPRNAMGKVLKSELRPPATS